MPMTARRTHAQVRTRAFKCHRNVYLLQPRVTTILSEEHDRLTGRLTVGKHERLTGTLTFRPPACLPPACPWLCVYLLVRLISSLARLCDWNKNDACANLQTEKRACTFRPIYSLSPFVCALPFCSCSAACSYFHTVGLCALSFVAVSACF